MGTRLLCLLTLGACWLTGILVGCGKADKEPDTSRPQVVVTGQGSVGGSGLAEKSSPFSDPAELPPRQRLAKALGVIASLAPAEADGTLKIIRPGKPALGETSPELEAETARALAAEAEKKRQASAERTAAALFDLTDASTRKKAIAGLVQDTMPTQRAVLREFSATDADAVSRRKAFLAARDDVLSFLVDRLKNDPDTECRGQSATVLGEIGPSNLTAWRKLLGPPAFSDRDDSVLRNLHDASESSSFQLESVKVAAKKATEQIRRLDFLTVKAPYGAK